MRPIVLVQMDKARPALVLAREIARPYLVNVTIAPVTSTVRGLSTEVALGRRNGLDHDCAASCDNLTTVPRAAITKQIGWLLDSQEGDLAAAVGAAFDLQIG